MSDQKPTIICAGLFEERHSTLYHELRRLFSVWLFSCSGAWPDARTIEITQHPIEKLTLTETYRAYWNFFSEIESDFDLAENSDEKKRVVKYLVAQWMQIHSTRKSLLKFNDKHAVSAIVVVNDHLAPHRALVEFGKDLNIPTVHVEHAFTVAEFLPALLKEKAYFISPGAEILCVANKLQEGILKEHLAGQGWYPTIHVTGNPVDTQPVIARDERTDRDAGSNECTIVFCPSWLEANRVQEILFGDAFEHEAFMLFCEMIKNLSALLPEKKLAPVVKLHPTLAKTIGTDTSSYYARTASDLGVDLARIDDGPIANWLRAADLIVTSRHSSVTWEAFVKRIPSMTYASDLYKETLQENSWPRSTLLAQWGAQEFYDASMDWAAGAMRLLNSKWDGSFARLCEENTAACDFIDGKKASENVVQLLKDEIGNGTKLAQHRKFRILEIVHDFPPASCSGTELYTLNLSHELQKLGHNVTVLHPVVQHDSPPNAFIETTYDGLRVVQYNVYDGTTRFRSDFDNPNYDEPFRDFLHNADFDIVHFQHVYGMSASWISIAKQLGLTVFLKIDDMFFFCRAMHLNDKEGRYCSGPESLDKCFACVVSPNENADPEKIAEGYRYLAFRRAYLRKVFMEPDFVQSTSHFLKDKCLKYGLSNDHFKVISTGIAPFEIEKPPIQRTTGDPLRVAFLGHIAERKGIQDFLQSIERFQKLKAVGRPADQDLCFKIYGSHFDDELYRAMISKVAELKNTTYEGSFSPKDRGKIFSQIDLLVMPSLGENYPFILREALYAGVPVIASTIAGVPEIVKTGVNGFLYPPGDTDSLTNLFTEISKGDRDLPGLNPAGPSIKLISAEARELEEEFYKARARAELTANDATERRLTLEVQFRTGKQLLQAGRLAEGLTELAKVLELEPDHSETIQLMGDVYNQLGQSVKAQEMWQMASRLQSCPQTDARA